MPTIHAKTIIPQRPGVYASFPTLITHGTDVYMFYRQGRTDPSQVHGLNGKVRCLRIPTANLLASLTASVDEALLPKTDTELPFAGPNELDAIASRLDDNLFALGTRTYLAGRLCQAYISFAGAPQFTHRAPLSLPDLHTPIFYGQGFASPQGYVFPAYGRLATDRVTRPLLLVTEDCASFRVLSTLPTNLDGRVILNECSVVHDGEAYLCFIRQDSEPFGIWLSRSVDLLTWSAPRKLITKAHAPMALNVNNTIYLAYRDLSAPDETRIRLCTPFASGMDYVLDTYRGNPYDGGYVSLCSAQDRLLAAYYLGNPQGEPCIKLSTMALCHSASCH